MVLGAVYNPQPQYPVNPLRSAPLAPYPTMRYYRLWIYTCNGLLFMSAIGFSIVLAKVLVLDPRRQLVPTLSLAQPSFLYAVAALLFQSGVIQTVGCLGASRLNDRLLNIYLLLLLVLLLGDILLGVVWLYRYDRISADLRPFLNHSFVLRYGVDPEFTTLWDAVQSQYRCCGVYSYADFLQYNLTVDTGLYNGGGGGFVPTAGGTIAVPRSCCRESPLVAAALRNFHYAVSTTTASPSGGAGSGGAAHIVTRAAAAVATHHRPPPPPPLGVAGAGGSTNGRVLHGGGFIMDERRCAGGGLVHQQNCHRVIIDWLNSTAHILFVLGYCVIAFIKLCFLGILRYEIKEMIQKIKLVQESEKAEGAEMSRSSKQNNGTILQVTQSNSIIRESGGDPERKTTSATKPDRRHVSNVLQDAGTDSDTNSHCALILNDASDTPAHTGHATPHHVTQQIGSGGTNGNNNYEMGDLSGHRPRT
ncbi:Tetraspanin family [Nesidiocoris tenuis]|uniref:Tetraspanin family n=1 Tax=Nesidiocoris tenuis TaxID=355587 RepID=A0ABN7AT62_9HEMI|nr:Tetraspanin family [Nesidiocoris tenuis]